MRTQLLSSVRSYYLNSSSLFIQTESTNETARVKSKSYGLHGEEEILLWELTNLTTPEQVVWTEGQVRLQTHELEEFQVRFQINQHSSATGYFSLDEFLIFETDKCDTQPPEAEPAAAAQGLETLLWPELPF